MIRERADAPWNRLVDAVATYVERQHSPTPEPEDDFLARHETIRDLLQALLDPSDDGSPEGVAIDVLAPRQTHPSRVGPYRIVDAIGRGGMGVVYRAEQDAPIRRTVAVKLIKDGWDTSRLVARFDAERQALAAMSHPNIARVFDAGATEDGRPYFVMEFVPGVAITDYADAESLTVRERLALFLDVCHAVQHAHQRGIIHRDLKPSNVLVTKQDGRAMVKVIDFGVAKATGESLSDARRVTFEGQLVGTLEYMSPEQVDSDGHDVDTRADVYALGVLLYEVLTGALPLDSPSLRRAPIDEVCRRIRETEPPRPSSRFSLDRPDAADIARRRRSYPRALEREIRGDLDWIVQRALEKDRARRYGGASDLADDVARHLTDEPILASPPSAAYRLRKFARRHRVGVAAATAVFVAMTAGLIASLAFNRKAAIETRRHRAVSEFLVHMIGSPTPGIDGHDVKMVDFVDRAAHELPSQFENEPAIRAELERAIGNAYHVLAREADAEPHLRIALDLDRRALGEDDPETLRSLYSLALFLYETARAGDAEPLFRQAIDGLSRQLGNEDPEVLADRSSLFKLLVDTRRFDEAEHLACEIVDACQRVLGDDHPDTLGALNNLLAFQFQHRGRHEALGELETGIEACIRRYGSDHRNVKDAQNNLVAMKGTANPSEEAEAALRATYRENLKRYGENHPTLCYSMNNLALCLVGLRKFEEAEVLYRRIIHVLDRPTTSNHPEIARAIRMLGQIRLVQGTPESLDQSRTFLEHAIARLRGIEGPDGPELLAGLTDLSYLCSLQQNFAESEAILREVLQIERRRASSPDSAARTLYNLACLAKRRGDLAAAESALRESWSRRINTLGEAHLWTLDAADLLGDVLTLRGDRDEAKRLLTQVVEFRVKDRTTPATKQAASRLNLAKTLGSLGCVDDAEDELLKALHVIDSDDSEAAAAIRADVNRLMDDLRSEHSEVTPK